MRSKSFWTIIIGLPAVAVAATTILLLAEKEAPKTMETQTNNQSSSLKLVSQVFRDGAAIPAQYTCRGQNVNPPLNIMGVPAGTKSLALIVHDPDAVSGDFVHWTAWDIPIATTEVAANSVPTGTVQGINSAGRAGYMGPCPPAGTGTHHYIFELYALDKTLGLKNNTDRDQLKNAMEGHILAQHILTGLFSAD